MKWWLFILCCRHASAYAVFSVLVFSLHIDLFQLQTSVICYILIRIEVNVVRPEYWETNISCIREKMAKYFQLQTWNTLRLLGICSSMWDDLNNQMLRNVMRADSIPLFQILVFNQICITAYKSCVLKSATFKSEWSIVLLLWFLNAKILMENYAYRATHTTGHKHW